MRRRTLAIALLGTTVRPPGSWAQAPRQPIVGFLGASTASSQADWTNAFLQRLGELGWIEGRTVAIEYRWGEGRAELFAEYAAEFVRLKVDVMLTDGGGTLAAMKATSKIPIVFAVAADPLGAGYVTSLSKPGGNVTGASVQASDTAGQRLGLLREVVPGLKRLAILVNPAYSPAVIEAGQVEAAASRAGIATTRVAVSRTQEIAPAFGAIVGRADGLYVCTDSFANSNRQVINESAFSARLPAIHGISQTARSGGLMAYGANFPALFRRAAETVDKILRGARPGDLPVEQPVKFDLVVNLRTAKALRLTIPPSVLQRADEVIE